LIEAPTTSKFSYQQQQTTSTNEQLSIGLFTFFVKIYLIDQRKIFFGSRI
jgi:hypothetical protein